MLHAFGGKWVSKWLLGGILVSNLINCRAESATLAVLPNAPSLIYPGKNQIKLLSKRNRLC
jgi:penicillin-binding protein 1C